MKNAKRGSKIFNGVRTEEGPLNDTTGRKFEQEITEITETDKGNSVPFVCTASIVIPASFSSVVLPASN
jgi:hypothetical protein